MAKEIETCEGTPVIEANDRETLESKVQSEEIHKFCESVIGFKNYTIFDMKTGVSAHNNKLAWKLFIENVQERFSNVPGISKKSMDFAPHTLPVIITQPIKQRKMCSKNLLLQ